MNSHDTTPGDRLARLRRAEALLDAWIAKFEAALADARPDPSKTTELANVFAILKRVLEIEALQQRLDAARHAPGEADADARFRLDPDLLGGGLLDGDPDG